MAGLVIDDGIKESDYGYVLRVSGPCKLLCVCFVHRVPLKLPKLRGLAETTRRQVLRVDGRVHSQRFARCCNARNAHDASARAEKAASKMCSFLSA